MIGPTIEYIGRIAHIELITRAEQFDIERALDGAGAILLNRIRTRFLDQEDSDGVQWPVSEAALHRRTIGQDGGTLFDTGTLFNSIQLFREGPGIRGIGTDVFYSLVHQEGSGVNLKREFLSFSDEDDALYARVLLARYIGDLT